MRKNKIILITSVLAACVGLGLLFILFGNSQPASGHVAIKDLGKCSKNINGVVADNISTKLYALVKSANDYNKSGTVDAYKATIRSDSCQQSDATIVETSDGGQRSVETSTLIVDIAEAKQSWKITYDWVTNKESLSDVDLGTIQPSCLKTDQLLYGDFKCENILSLAKYGTDKIDPILQYMPYSGAGFKLEYSPDTRVVSVLILPPSGTKDVAAFTENTKAVIPYWFQKRGLDQSKYTIVYNSESGENADN
jgi:hypothetical protein